MKSIVTSDGDLEEAFAGQAVTLTLEKEVDISRGDTLVHPGNLPQVGERVEAMVVWMAEEPMRLEKQYLGPRDPLPRQHQHPRARAGPEAGA